MKDKINKLKADPYKQLMAFISKHQLDSKAFDELIQIVGNAMMMEFYHSHFRTASILMDEQEFKKIFGDQLEQILTKFKLNN
jgi:hypothetical protein